MIHVIAMMQAHEGSIQKLVDAFQAILPTVQKEERLS